MLNKPYVLPTQYIYVFCMDPRKSGYYFHKQYHLIVQNKKNNSNSNRISLYVATCFDSYWIIIHTKRLKHSNSTRSLHNISSEISLIIFFKNIKT